MTHKDILKNLSKDLNIPYATVDKEIDKYFKVLKDVIKSMDYNIIILPRFARMIIHIARMRQYIKTDTGQKTKSVIEKIELFTRVLQNIKGKFKDRVNI